MTETDLNTIYNVKTNFLEYHRVIKYIKAFCNKVNDRNHMKPIYHSQTQILLRSQKGSKDFYNRLNNINVKKTTSYYSHWEQALKTKITEKDWKFIYQNCFKTVEDNDLVWFQYRLLNRILGTNEYLVKIKQKVNANCSFCKKETENITHLFIECNFVKKFWTDLKRNLHFSLGVDLNINPSDIIFGILGSNNKKTIINLIILAAKSFIFKASRSNGQLSQQTFGSFVKEIYLSQEYASKLKDKHTDFI